MRIQKIRLKNFKSFYEETTIDFDKLEGLWQISGSIGSGKTSIGEAIIYGLYGRIQDKPLKSLISWGQKRGVVELWGLSKGKSLYIRREINSYGQSPMEVYVDSEEIIFTNKRSAQEQLEQEYLDVPVSSMELLCIISFNNFKSLSSLNTKDTKLFLDNVLGFDRLTQYIDSTKSAQNTSKNLLIKINAEIAAVQNQINRLNDKISNKLLVSESALELGSKNDLENDLRSINKEITKIQNEYQDSYKLKLAEKKSKETEINQILVLGKVNKKELDSVSTGICPTCKSTISKSYINEIENERNRLLKVHTELTNDIEIINSELLNIKNTYEQIIEEQKSAAKSIEKELIKINEQTKVQQESIESDQAEITELELIKNESCRQIVEIDKDIIEYDQLLEIFKTGIQKKVLSSFVPTINNKINEIARMIGMKLIPQFNTDFKCHVSNNLSVDPIPNSSLSTGQLKLVDMVIILAILSSIISRVNSNIIFLDELFSNMDSRTRADLIRVLRILLPKDSSIFIISHQEYDTDTNNLFDGQLRLKNNNNSNSSYIEYRTYRIN